VRCSARTLVAPGAGVIRANQLKTFALQPFDATVLAGIAQVDARGSFQKACVSITDALDGIGRGMICWAAVKLYYATFYLARCRLLRIGECHLYIDRTPYCLNSQAGATIQKGKGTSHEFAFTRFIARFGGATSLSQTINGDPPLTWLKSVREEIQYTSPRFSDGGICTFLPRITQANATEVIRAYLGRDQLVLAFDPDHAVVAFPLLFFCETANEIVTGGDSMLTTAECSFLVQRLRIRRDSVGQIGQIFRKITGLD